MTYMMADQDSDADQFFYIDKESGQLMLKKSLSEGTGTEYRVSSKNVNCLNQLMGD